MSYLTHALDESRQRGDAFLAAARKAAASGPHPRQVVAAGYEGFLGQLNADDTASQAEEQMRHNQGRVYALLKVKAQRCAGQPVKVARRVRKGQRPLRPIAKDFLPSWLKAQAADLEVIDDHPLLLTFRDPNPLMTETALKLVTFFQLDITGRANWWVVPNDSKEPGAPPYQIWPLPPHWCKPVHTREKLYAAWEVQPDQLAKPFLIDGDDMVYFYYPDPADPMGALSPLQAQGSAVASDEAIAEAHRRTFANGIWPGLMITIGRHPELQIGAGGQQPRPHLSAEQRQQIVGWVKAMYRGMDRYNEPLIIDGLIESVQRLNQTPRELDFMASGKYSMDRLDQGFLTNPIVMGRVEGANRASASVADQHFTANNVNPTLALFSESLTAWLGPKVASPGEDIVVYVEPAQASDPEYTLQEEGNLIKGSGLKYNEFRARHNLPPIQEREDFLVGPTGPTPVPGSQADQERQARQAEQLAARQKPVAVPKPEPKAAGDLKTKDAAPAPVIVSPSVTIYNQLPEQKPADVKVENHIAVPEQKPPEVRIDNHNHNHLPEQKTPDVNVTVQPSAANVVVQPAEVPVTVNVPEQKSPTVNVHNAFPEQPAPVVNVSTHPAKVVRTVERDKETGLISKTVDEYVERK